MNIEKRVNIKKYKYAKVDLLIDYKGNKYVEKTLYHIPPAIPIPFEYGNNGFEVIKSILEPMKIQHPHIIESNSDDKCTAFIMEYIDGVNCADEPKAEYLYEAAKQAGTLYAQSKMSMHTVDAAVLEKYSLTKEKILSFIRIIEKQASIPSLDKLIDKIFDRSKTQTPFVNHGDMQLKNFIYNGDIHLIDWDNVKIHPFFSDLHSLVQAAHEIGADIEEVKHRYKAFAQIDTISDTDISIGGIIGNIIALFDLIISDCPSEWIKGTLDDLTDLVKSLSEI